MHLNWAAAQKASAFINQSLRLHEIVLFWLQQTNPLEFLGNAGVCCSSRQCVISEIPIVAKNMLLFEV